MSAKIDEARSEIYLAKAQYIKKVTTEIDLGFLKYSYSNSIGNVIISTKVM